MFVSFIVAWNVYGSCDQVEFYMKIMALLIKYRNCVDIQAHQNEFNTSAALYELYQYTQKYNDDVRIHSLQVDFKINFLMALNAKFK